MKVYYTRHAQRDLHGIFEYIAYTLEAPAAAKTTANKIMKEISLLRDFPERNPLYRDEPWRSQGVRALSIKKYLAFYTVKSDMVVVARIIYGGRDLTEQLEETTEW